MVAAVGTLDRLKRFLRDVRGEVRKVAWPNRKEIITYTIVVIITVVLLSLFTGAADVIISRLLLLLRMLGG